MIRISFLSGQVIFTAVWLLLRVIVWLRQGQINWRREAALLLMYVNLAVVFRFAFFPMEHVGGRVQPLVFDAANILPFRVNLRPFVRLSDYADKGNMLRNVIGNVAMMIPSGILFPVLYEKLNRLWKVLLAGLGLTLLIELLQLPFASRASDVDDVIQNVAGVMIGYGIYALFRALSKRKKSA